MLRRKIDDFLNEWHARSDRKPLIVRGARQIGKTLSIRNFAHKAYKNVVEINFALEPTFNNIFQRGYDVESVVKSISLVAPDMKFIPNETLIFFDEIQSCPAAATSLKSFCLDRRFDIICSGSLMGLNYNEIESNAVGHKEDYDMHSMDFEEFLWAVGYSDSQINDLYKAMLDVRPLTGLEMDVMMTHFRDYMTIGGMPEAVSAFVTNKTYENIPNFQKQLLRDYEEDITKYADGLDKGKVKSVYNHIPVFLAKDNKKFQVTKVIKNGRSRAFTGVVEWLNDAGIVNVCYCLEELSLPLKGNYNPQNFKLYYHDTGLLMASLDDEAMEDVRVNRNFGTYKGAIYENVVGEALVKQGYSLYYYRNEKSTVEIDFFVRNRDSLIPIEVKAKDGVPKSLIKLVNSDKYPDIKFGIKFGNKNIGFDGVFFTFPYFMTFLLRRFLSEKTIEC